MALKFNISICAIQEHRIMHSQGDPSICAHNIGPYTLFTASAWKTTSNATVGGVGILIKSSLLSLLETVDKISDRIVPFVVILNQQFLAIHLILVIRSLQLKISTIHSLTIFHQSLNIHSC